MLTVTIGALAGIFFLAYGVQTATGFGAALISLTLGAHLIGVTDLVLLILTLSLGQCGYIAVRYHGSIDWALLGRWVVPFMGTGAAAGVFVAGYLDTSMLRRLLGGFILTLAVLELVTSFRKTTIKPIGPVGSVIGLVGAGLMHGAYAVGGPLLVYTMARRELGKDVFRSTMTVVWLVLNFALVGYHLAVGHFEVAHAEALVPLVPAVVLGVIAGERVFRKIEGPRFLQFVFALLAVAALGLLLR